MNFKEEGQYELSVDIAKNRIYMTFSGGDKPENMPNYLKHVEELTNQVKKGYTLIIELTEETKNPNFAMTKLLMESQKIFMNKGVSKTVVVVPPTKIIQIMTLGVITKLSGMKIKVFNTKTDAANWLNEENEKESSKEHSCAN